MDFVVKLSCWSKGVAMFLSPRLYHPDPWLCTSGWLAECRDMDEGWADGRMGGWALAWVPAGGRLQKSQERRSWKFQDVSPNPVVAVQWLWSPEALEVTPGSHRLWWSGFAVPLVKNDVVERVRDDLQISSLQISQESFVIHHRLLSSPAQSRHSGAMRAWWMLVHELVLWRQQSDGYVPWRRSYHSMWSSHPIIEVTHAILYQFLSLHFRVSVSPFF